MSLIPESYRLLQSCITCKHSAAIIDHDEPDQFFCAFGAPSRPKSGSTYMGESFGRIGKLLSIKAEEVRAWYEWSAERSVLAYGICDEYEEKKLGG